MILWNFGSHFSVKLGRKLLTRFMEYITTKLDLQSVLFGKRSHHRTTVASSSYTTSRFLGIIWQSIFFLPVVLGHYTYSLTKLSYYRCRSWNRNKNNLFLNIPKNVTDRWLIIRVRQFFANWTDMFINKKFKLLTYFRISRMNEICNLGFQCLGYNLNTHI